MLAALATTPAGGALVMAAFVLGTSITMFIAPWLLLRWGMGNGEWGMRLAGAGLAVSSAWALWMALAHNEAPWCVTLA
jgi:sulfite exporter TauE/SafE